MGMLLSLILLGDVNAPDPEGWVGRITTNLENSARLVSQMGGCCRLPHLTRHTFTKTPSTIFLLQQFGII